MLNAIFSQRALRRGHPQKPLRPERLLLLGHENTNGNEIWIFDARTLDEPICKLYHPKLNIGFTVHSTWMAQAERRTAPYYISPEADYGPLLKDQGVEVKDLFERWVFPRKEPQAGDC